MLLLVCCCSCSSSRCSRCTAILSPRFFSIWMHFAGVYSYSIELCVGVAT
jgi:hypothetical protein